MTLREIFNFILDFPIGYIFIGIIVLVLIGWLISKFEFAFDVQDEEASVKTRLFAFLKICVLCLIAILGLFFYELYAPQHWKFWE